MINSKLYDFYLDDIFHYPADSIRDLLKKKTNRGHSNTSEKITYIKAPSLGHSEEPGYHLICL